MRDWGVLYGSQDLSLSSNHSCPRETSPTSTPVKHTLPPKLILIRLTDPSSAGIAASKTAMRLIRGCHKALS